MSILFFFIANESIGSETWKHNFVEALLDRYFTHFYGMESVMNRLDIFNSFENHVNSRIFPHLIQNKWENRCNCVTSKYRLCLAKSIWFHYVNLYLTNYREIMHKNQPWNRCNDVRLASLVIFILSATIAENSNRKIVLSLSRHSSCEQYRFCVCVCIPKEWFSSLFYLWFWI